MRINLTKVGELRTFKVALLFPNSKHWEYSKVKLEGNRKSRQLFLRDFELARGSHGLFLDLGALTLGDLSVALSNELSLWVPDRELEVKPERKEVTDREVLW